MPRYGPDETLDIHVTAEAGARFRLDDLVDFDERQYKVVAYKPQPDGTVKILLTPTGNPASFQPPTSH